MSLVPDQLLWRRVAALERQVASLEATLRRISSTRSVTPLTARLWRATLNEAFGATTAHVAAADLLTLDGVDTGLDISLYDPLDSYTAMVSDDPLYVLEQIDMDGTRRFVPTLPQSTANMKRLCRFTLDAALATSDASKAATITTQYGEGTSHSTTAITVHNLLTHTAGTYVFEGDSGDAGLAYFNSSGNWVIIQMECP